MRAVVSKVAQFYWLSKAHKASILLGPTVFVLETSTSGTVGTSETTDKRIKPFRDQGSSIPGRAKRCHS